MADSPELAEARDAIGKAVNKFVETYRKDNEMSDVFVMAWALHTEFIPVDMTQKRTSQSMVIIPDEQLISTSIGLLHLGIQQFNRSMDR